jgi:hypothetical protein
MQHKQLFVLWRFHSLSHRREYRGFADAWVVGISDMHFEKKHSFLLIYI